MNVEDIIRSKLNDYSKYDAAQKEIEAIDELFKERFGSGLYEYQKQFILNLHTCQSGCLTKKCRRAGISSVYGAHIAYLAKTQGDKMGRIFVCACSKELANDVLEYARSFCHKSIFGLNEIAIINKKVVCCTARNAANHLCGCVYEEAFLDEASFINNFKELVSIISPTGTKVFAASSQGSNEDSDAFSEVFDDVESESKVLGGKWETQTINWFEVPYYNKNLVWKKVLVEPTIDKAGNIKYDKSRWTKLISEGWIPTSSAFEKLVDIMGRDKAEKELLN